MGSGQGRGQGGQVSCSGKVRDALGQFPALQLGSHCRMLGAGATSREPTQQLSCSMALHPRTAQGHATHPFAWHLVTTKLTQVPLCLVHLCRVNCMWNWWTKAFGISMDMYELPGWRFYQLILPGSVSIVLSNNTISLLNLLT